MSALIRETRSIVRRASELARAFERCWAAAALGGLILMAALAVIGCGGKLGSSLGSVQLADTIAVRTLGFESVDDWTVSSGTLSSSDRAAEGAHSIGISGVGYTEITSRQLSSLSTVESTVSFDLLLPIEQPNPWWYGSVTLLVNLPSQGVNWQSIGTVSLTGLPLDSFQRFLFTLPGELVTKLSASYTDLQFRFVLNVPYGTGTYLLDRLWLGEQQDLDAGAGGAGSGDAGAPPTGETVNFTIPLPRQVEVHAVGLGANGALLLGDHVTVADVGGQAVPVTNMGTSGETNIGVETHVQNLYSRPSVVIRDRGVVEEDALSAGTVTLGHGASVQGSTVEGASFDPQHDVGWNTVFPNEVASDIMLEPGQELQLDPGHYGSLSVKPGAKLYVSSGTYTARALHVLEPQSELHVDQSGGPVVIYVKNAFTFRGAIVIDSGGDPELLIGYFGTDPVFIESPFRGGTISPRTRGWSSAPRELQAIWPRSLLAISKPTQACRSQSCRSTSGPSFRAC